MRGVHIRDIAGLGDGRCEVDNDDLLLAEGIDTVLAALGNKGNVVFAKTDAVVSLCDLGLASGAEYQCVIRSAG